MAISWGAVKSFRVTTAVGENAAMKNSEARPWVLMYHEDAGFSGESKGYMWHL